MFRTKDGRFWHSGTMRFLDEHAPEPKAHAYREDGFCAEVACTAHREDANTSAACPVRAWNGARSLPVDKHAKWNEYREEQVKRDRLYVMHLAWVYLSKKGLLE